MAAEVVYRLIAGEGIDLVEESGTRTVTVAVPGLAQKIGIGDIGQASTTTAGLIEIATDPEVQAMADDQRAVTPGGLGAAAQSSAIDATAGRLLKVGAFGLGGNVVEIASGDMLDTARPTGFYQFTSTTINKPIAGIGFDGVVRRRDNGAGGIDIYISASSNVSPSREFRNRYVSIAGTWLGWVEYYHTGNFDPSAKANTSGSYPGLDVGNAATVGGQLATDLAPPGQRGEFFMQTAPAGWLKANGAAVSRTTYARLFSAIGTFWGGGNGSSTFNLPDARGFFARAWDDGRGIDGGRAFGSEQMPQNLSHSHGGATGSAGAHSHTVTRPQSLVDSDRGTTPSLWSIDTNETATTSSAADHAHSISAEGGAEVRVRNQAVLVCIKY